MFTVQIAVVMESDDGAHQAKLTDQIDAVDLDQLVQRAGIAAQKLVRKANADLPKPKQPEKPHLVQDHVGLERARTQGEAIIRHRRRA